MRGWQISHTAYNTYMNLRMNALETIAFKRTQTSALDHRPTAKAVGHFVVGLMVVLFWAFVIPDILKLYRDLKYGSDLTRKKLK